MPIFKRNDQTVFFSHVPKTGGSSIELLLIQNGFKMSFVGGCNPCSKQHRHKNDPELISTIKLTVPDYKFTVIRHPVERALSEFFFQSSRPPIATSADFYLWAKKTINKFENNNFMADNHIRPQIEFLWDNINIFKFGDWNVLVNGLSKALDLQIEDFPCVQQGPGFDANLHCNSTEFSSKVLGWVPDKKTTDLLEDFYKEDLRLFNSL
jgi:hypothetical protein